MMVSEDYGCVVSSCIDVYDLVEVFK